MKTISIITHVATFLSEIMEIKIYVYWSFSKFLATQVYITLERA